MKPVYMLFLLASVFIGLPQTQGTCELVQISSDDTPAYINSHDHSYSTNYANFEDKCWIVRATSFDKRLLINVIAFSLEYEYNCNYDRLQFRTDTSTYGPYCGDAYSNMPFQSEVMDSYQVTINFTSDYSVTDTGFILQLRSVSDSYTDNLDSWPWDDYSTYYPAYSTHSWPWSWSSTPSPTWDSYNNTDPWWWYTTIPANYTWPWGSSPSPTSWNYYNNTDPWWWNTPSPGPYTGPYYTDDYSWPWGLFSTTTRHPDYMSTTRAPGEVAASTGGHLWGWSLGGIIGLGVGILLMGILLGAVVGLLACYLCNKSKVKVHSQNTAAVHSQGAKPQPLSYQGTGMNVSSLQTQYVYTVPTQPPTNRLPPLAGVQGQVIYGNGLPPKSTAMPGNGLTQHQAMMPTQPPYPVQRYQNTMTVQQAQMPQPLLNPAQGYQGQQWGPAQPMMQQQPVEIQPNLAANIPDQQQAAPPTYNQEQESSDVPPPANYIPEQQPPAAERTDPLQKPKFSVDQVAFALRQPMPLKPVAAPFGENQAPVPVHRTSDQVMAQGRARLKWQNMAAIPPAPAYDVPSPQTGVATGSANQADYTGVAPGGQQNRGYDDQDAWMYADNI